jgi:hypothetical protein
MATPAAQGAALEVVDLKTYKLNPTEQRALIANCQRLKQVKSANIANNILMVEVDMGPLKGDIMKQAIDILLVRIIRMVQATRESDTLHLAHSKG